MECREILITWLKDAYAMEHAMIKNMRAHIGDMEGVEGTKEAVSKIEEHISQTESQAEKLKSEIERLGEDVSTLKTEMAELGAAMSGLMSDMSADKMIKNAIADHAAEHLEMATYQAIAKAAEMCEEDETAQMAREIMEQETKMGEQLETELDNMVEKYINMKVERDAGEE